MKRIAAFNLRLSRGTSLQLTIAGGLSSLFLAASLAAEEPREASESQGRAQIEDIIVTARRVEESLQDTPVSLAVFSNRDLEQLGTTEIGDISRHTPGLELRTAAGSLDTYVMAMRGMAISTIDQSVDPPIGLYVDGIYQARNSGMAVDLVDLQRIEVLRGPQGTLFGRNTIGGAINIVTEKPRGELAVKQGFTYGARGRQRIQTTVDTARVANVAAKLSFVYAEHDGLVNGMYTGRRHGAKDSTGFRLALNWQPVESVEIDYAFDISRRKSNASTTQYVHVRPIVADPNGAFYGGAYYETMAATASRSRKGQVAARSSSKDNESDVDGHALTVEWETSPNLVIKSISSYRERDLSESPEFGVIPAPGDGSLCASPAPGDYDFGTGTCSNPVPEGELISSFHSIELNQTQEQWSQELQFIGTALADRLSYTTGLYYFQEKGDEISPARQMVMSAAFLAAQAEADAGLPPGTLVPQNRGNSVVLDLPLTGYEFDHRAYAAYGDITYALTPQFDATLGLRYTIDERKATVINESNNQLITRSDDNRWSNFTPAFTLSYRWSEELSTYAKVVTGYRSGGYDVRAATIPTQFDEEEVTSYEAGWKSDLFGRSLRFNGAVFYANYKDRQIASLATGTEGAQSQTLNAGESAHFGIELDAVWLPTRNLELSASYAYLDVDIKKFLTQREDPVTAMPINAGTVSDIKNEASSPYSPEHSAAVAAEYRFDPWQWGQLTLRVDANYTDEITFVPQLHKFSASQSHTLVNARATLADIPAGPDGSLRLALWGRNLTNERVREFGIDFGALGFAMATHIELASWGIDLIYDFNR